MLAQSLPTIIMTMHMQCEFFTAQQRNEKPKENPHSCQSISCESRISAIFSKMPSEVSCLTESTSIRHELGLGGLSLIEIE